MAAAEQDSYEEELQQVEALARQEWKEVKRLVFNGLWSNRDQFSK
jgi:hypothetical protein